MKIIVAADHGGLKNKNDMVTYLTSQGIEVIDVGAKEYKSEDDYADYAWEAAKKWRENQEAKIILWCKSGVGMMIAINRYQDILCGMGISPEQLALAVRDDHLNALALASCFTSQVEQEKLIKVFLETPKGNQERFCRRLQKLEKYAQIENQRIGDK